jgi:hypothetical protein
MHLFFLSGVGEAFLSSRGPLFDSLQSRWPPLSCLDSSELHPYAPVQLKASVPGFRKEAGVPALRKEAGDSKVRKKGIEFRA